MFGAKLNFYSVNCLFLPGNQNINIFVFSLYFFYSSFPLNRLSALFSKRGTPLKNRIRTKTNNGDIQRMYSQVEAQLIAIIFNPIHNTTSPK